MEMIFNYIQAEILVTQNIHAIIVFFLFTIVFLVVKRYVLVKVKSLAARTRSDIDDLIVKTVETLNLRFGIILAFSAAIFMSTLPDVVKQVTTTVLILYIAYVVVRNLEHFLDFFITRIIKSNKISDGSAIKNFITFIAKFLLWTVAILIVLENLEYDITTLLGGLGIAGIAVAFAINNTLGDIFSFLVIYFDKPFKKNDFITIGEDNGVIERVGIKSTRIRTLEGQELVVSNKELVESRINNYGRMKQRRVAITIGLAYETSNTLLKKAKNIISKALEKEDLVTLDRIHFKEFGDFSLNLEIVYFIKTSDFNTFMDVQERANFFIKEKFEKAGIEMAYPTSVIIRKNIVE